MKTLVIHLKDKSTDFLKSVYENRDWTIINNDLVTKRVLIENIKSHDRIIMLGHGTELGLIRPGTGSYLINSKLVYLLRQKECIGIWCKANQFFNLYGLKGICTGMIISEIAECYDYYMTPTDEQFKESNFTFSLSIKRLIACNNLDQFLNLYNNNKNPLIRFNRKRVFIKSEKNQDVAFSEII